MEKPLLFTETVIVPNDLAFAEVGTLLAEGKAVTLRAKGNSMFPFIREGRDEIILEKCTDIVPGDIVLAHLSNGRHVVHRIIRMEDEHITLMGDGNRCATESCLRKDIIGKVTCILREGKPTDCNSRRQRQLAKWWTSLLPIRRYLLAACRIMNQLKLSK